jgi:hypothetical protein
MVDFWLNISGIVSLYVLCLVAPMLPAIVSGIGAKIFGYIVVPGSTLNTLVFVLGGYLGAKFTDLIYSHFNVELPWWVFLIVAVYYIRAGSLPTTNIAGRGLSFGSTLGIFIFLLIR